MSLRLKLPAVGLLLVGVGCQDEQRGLTAVPVPSGAAVFYLAVSNGTPAAGTTIVVTANQVVSAGRKLVGSFAGDVRFDSIGLTFVGESRLPTGIRALNPRPGRIRVAGAAAEGFKDGRLFALQFVVNDPKALVSLQLSLAELNGSDFTNQLPSDQRLRTVRFAATRRK